MLSPEARRKAIEALASPEGEISPEQIVDVARDPKHPLHGEFDWNDQTAAHAHRLATARRLIREAKLVVRIEHFRAETVAYVKNPNNKANEQGYISLDRVAARSRDAFMILEDEITRIQAAVTRARGIAAVLGIGDHLEAILAEISLMRETARASSNKRKSKAKARVRA